MEYSIFYVIKYILWHKEYSMSYSIFYVIKYILWHKEYSMSYSIFYGIQYILCHTVYSMSYSIFFGISFMLKSADKLTWSFVSQEEFPSMNTFIIPFFYCNNSLHDHCVMLA